jgi:hypothetical protein
MKVATLNSDTIEKDNMHGISSALYQSAKYSRDAASFEFISVAETHPFYAALAPGINFYAAPVAPAPAPAPTLLYSKAKFLKLTKV